MPQPGQVSPAAGPTDTPAPPPGPDAAPAPLPGPDARRAMGRATVPLPSIARASGPSGAPPAGPPVAAASPAGQPVAASGATRVYRASQPPPSGFYGSVEEDSGSLTGAVLARGSADQPDPGAKARTAFIVLAIAGVVVVLALFGLVVAAATSDVVSSVFDGLLS